MALPIESGTPYQEGTTSAHAAQTHDGQPVVVAVFGNVFSETVMPLTRKAAQELRNQLDAVLHEATP